MMENERKEEVQKQENTGALAKIETGATDLKIDEEAILELKRQYDLFRKLQENVLEKEIDFGYPAGKHGKYQKPSLYKSGAEKLTRLFKLIPRFEIMDEVKKKDFIMYEVRCYLYSQSGILIGEGFGACNSDEKLGWKENPWKHQNSILKMAKKRAHVDAALTGLGASNVFTQDIEDFEEEHATGEHHTNTNTKPMTEKQIEYLDILIGKYAKKYKKSREEVVKSILEKYRINDINELDRDQAGETLELLSKAVGKKKVKVQKGVTKVETPEEQKTEGTGSDNVDAVYTYDELFGNKEEGQG